MTGQDFQDRLDAIVTDLQTVGKGQTVNVMFRSPTNAPNILPLSSDVDGVVDAAQLAAIQAAINPLKFNANNYATQYEPVQAASEAFKIAQAPHEALIEAARVARVALNEALAANPAYQTAKTDLDTARNNPAYIAAKTVYENLNVSENFAALGQAKGEYIV